MSKFDPLIQKITDFAQSFEANDNTLREAKTCFFDSIACAFLALEHEKVQNFCSLPYIEDCLLYTSPSPRDPSISRMPSSA